MFGQVRTRNVMLHRSWWMTARQGHTQMLVRCMIGLWMRCMCRALHTASVQCSFIRIRHHSKLGRMSMMEMRKQMCHRLLLLRIVLFHFNVSRLGFVDRCNLCSIDWRCNSSRFINGMMQLIISSRVVIGVLAATAAVRRSRCTRMMRRWMQCRSIRACCVCGKHIRSESRRRSVQLGIGRCTC